MSGPVRPLAVMMSRFPRLTETFILREMDELERQGQPVRVVPLLREKPSVVHREVEPWLARTLYTPFLSGAILAANARALWRRPRRTLAAAARVLAGTASSPNLFARTAALLPKCVYLAERLQEERVGHVHAHFATHPTTAALLVGALADIPFSFTVHAHDIFVRRALLGEKMRRARFVRAISRFNREFLAARYPEVAHKIQVIHAGVDPRQYSASTEVGSPPRILCVAALRPYKGLAVLVEACLLLRAEGIAFVCDLVGDGALRAEIEAQVAAAQLQDVVRLRGQRRQDEVARLLGEASVLVHPSVVAPDGQMDGIPVALMEAMAAGVPVIASRLSGIPELVEDGVSGLLVPPGNAAALAAALGRLAADPAEARRLGRRGQETVRREFRLDACVAALLGEIAEHRLASEPHWQARLEQAWPELASGALGLRRLVEGRQSMVAELLRSHGDEAQSLVLKAHKPFPGQARPPAESAWREFEMLSRLHRCFSIHHPGFGVPRPLGWREPGAALLMEACRGRPLVDLLREDRGNAERFPALAGAMSRAGRWLRLFQEHTAREGGADGLLETVVAGARADLRACVAEGRLRPPLARQLEARLTAAAGGVGRQTLRAVLHHGDFWPGNVFVDAEGVQVIDLEGWREGLPDEDAAYFLLHLELFMSYPWRRRAGRRLAAAFLEGYRDGRPRDPQAWALSWIAKAAEILRREGQKSLPVARRSWRGRILRRMLREALG